MRRRTGRPSSLSREPLSGLCTTCGETSYPLLAKRPRRRSGGFARRMFYLMSEVDAQALYIHRKHVGLKHIYDEAPVAVEAAQRCVAQHAAIRGK